MPFTVTPTGAAIAVTAVNVAATTARSLIQFGLSIDLFLPV